MNKQNKKKQNHVKCGESSVVHINFLGKETFEEKHYREELTMELSGRRRGKSYYKGHKCDWDWGFDPRLVRVIKKKRSGGYTQRNTWGQDGESLEGHCNDPDFCSKYHRKHCKIQSIGVTWSDLLSFRRIALAITEKIGYSQIRTETGGWVRGGWRNTGKKWWLFRPWQ